MANRRMLVAFTLGFASIAGCMSAQGKLNRAVGKLKVDMTQQEVRAEIGSPDHVSYASSGSTVWGYSYTNDGSFWAAALQGASATTAAAGGDSYGQARAEERQRETLRNQEMRGLYLKFDSGGYLMEWRTD